ncbi:hypothetical protein T4D_10124 [Trichinella pseudospiralis]|uniref:Uncharacterized protein n=1 Tax=Trichinella pseudospiralis TaxID=6337 RepID=A0A0V1FSL9_TRIPS|nr:hypothetical protein T4D_10124 [Trichinella pseudospiralis]
MHAKGLKRVLNLKYTSVQLRLFESSSSPIRGRRREKKIFTCSTGDEIIVVIPLGGNFNMSKSKMSRRDFFESHGGIVN